MNNNDVVDVNNFELDKMMRIIGTNSLKEDINIKMMIYEDKAFRIVAMSLLISLLLLFINYLW